MQGDRNLDWNLLPEATQRNKNSVILTDSREKGHCTKKIYILANYTYSLAEYSDSVALGSSLQSHSKKRNTEN